MGIAPALSGCHPEESRSDRDDEGAQLQEVAALAVGAQAFEVINGNRNHAGPTGDGDASLDEMAHDVVMARRVN